MVIRPSRCRVSSRTRWGCICLSRCWMETAYKNDLQLDPVTGSPSLPFFCCQGTPTLSCCEVWSRVLSLAAHAEESYRSKKEGRRPRNRPIEELDDSDPGLASRRQEALSNQRGYCTKGRGPKDPSVRWGGDPRTLASRRHWLLLKFCPWTPSCHTQILPRLVTLDLTLSSVSTEEALKLSSEMMGDQLHSAITVLMLLAVCAPDISDPSTRWYPSLSSLWFWCACVVCTTSSSCGRA